MTVIERIFVKYLVCLRHHTLRIYHYKLAQDSDTRISSPPDIKCADFDDFRLWLGKCFQKMLRMKWKGEVR